MRSEFLLRSTSSSVISSLRVQAFPVVGLLGIGVLAAMVLYRQLEQLQYICIGSLEEEVGAPPLLAKALRPIHLSRERSELNGNVNR